MVLNWHLNTSRYYFHFICNVRCQIYLGICRSVSRFERRAGKTSTAKCAWFDLRVHQFAYQLDACSSTRVLLREGTSSVNSVTIFFVGHERQFGRSCSCQSCFPGFRVLRQCSSNVQLSCNFWCNSEGTIRLGFLLIVFEGMDPSHASEKRDVQSYCPTSPCSCKWNIWRIWSASW